MSVRRSMAVKLASSVVTAAVIALSSGGCWGPSAADLAAAVADACSQLSGPATAKAIDNLGACLDGLEKTPRSAACLTDDGHAAQCSTCERLELAPCSVDTTVKVDANISVAGYGGTASINLHVTAKATQEQARVSPSAYSGSPISETVTYMARYSDVSTTYSNGVVASVTSGSLPVSAGFSFDCKVEVSAKSFGKKATETTTCGGKTGQVKDADRTGEI